VGPDVKDAPQDIELFERDLQVRGVGDAALLGNDRMDEREKRRQDR
jgi:hypothetical protein